MTQRKRYSHKTVSTTRAKVSPLNINYTSWEKHRDTLSHHNYMLHIFFPPHFFPILDPYFVSLITSLHVHFPWLLFLGRESKRDIIYILNQVSKMTINLSLLKIHHSSFLVDSGFLSFTMTIDVDYCPITSLSIKSLHVNQNQSITKTNVGSNQILVCWLVPWLHTWQSPSVVIKRFITRWLLWFGPWFDV